MVDEKVAVADCRELLGRRLDRVPRRSPHSAPLVVLEVGPVELEQLAEIGEVEHPLERVDDVVGDAEPLLELVAHRPGHRPGHLETRHLAEARAAQLELDGLEQVVGLVRHVEVGVARDAEERPLAHVHPGEEARQIVGQHVLEGDEPPATAERQEPRQALRHLDPREPLLSRVGIVDEDSRG